MSPTEFDLRAALRDGEGEGLDAESLIASGRAYRTRRRVRILSAGAAAAFVVVAGTAVAALSGNSSNGGQNTADSAGAGGSSAAGPAFAPTGARAAAGTEVQANSHRAREGGLAGGVNSAPRPEPAIPVNVPACPATWQQRPLPGGGAPGAGASAAILPSTPASFVVCSYGEGLTNPATVAPKRLIFNGTAAADLTRSLREASTHPLGIACPEIATEQTYRLTLIPVTGDGHTLPPITATVPIPICNVMVTNGTAVRYDWGPPQALMSQLTGYVVPPAPTSVPGSGPAQRPGRVEPGTTITGTPGGVVTVSGGAVTPSPPR